MTIKPVTREMAAFIAVTRFGLGAAPGELALVAKDPDGWLKNQLAPPPPPPQLAGLASGAQLASHVSDLRAMNKDNKPGVPNPAANQRQQEIQSLIDADAAARTRLAVATQTPFYERLVQFWSNHFTVSSARGEISHLVGAFEREAIRPHVTGRFISLLRAAVRHPAMLMYLDNTSSIGPDSAIGKTSHRGLNENLARELMELHTLGVRGGYDQADVGQMARILTGWTVGDGKQGPMGQFMFQPRSHQPGPKTILGMTILEADEQEGDRALDILASHPSTARFIAEKLARHFIADDPPAEAVDALSKRFLDSGGDLAQVSACLIERPEPWQFPLSKMKTANDYVISTLRALAGPDLDDKTILRPLVLLGQRPFSASSPAGWGDRAADWMGPEQLMRRLEWARDQARRLHRLDVAALAEDTLGPMFADRLKTSLGTAADSVEATLLLLSCPQFQRR